MISVAPLWVLLMALVTTCGCGARNRAKAALDDARHLAAEGKYEEALETYVWFHHHALEADPRRYGSRLTTGLSDWITLGQKYPKALDALKEIRDEKTARLRAGEKDNSLFHDVEAINRHLGESTATLDLFKSIDAADSVFAAVLYPWAEGSLFEAKEYPLAHKYMGDPFARFDGTKIEFESIYAILRLSPVGDPSRVACEKRFSDRVVGIIKTLQSAGDTQTAQRIQASAMLIFATPEIRDALKQ